MSLCRLLFCLIVSICSIFSSTQSAVEEVTKPRALQILLVGFVPGETMTCYCNTSEGLVPIPERIQFTQMKNVHTLDRWCSGDGISKKIDHKCVHHKVDWMNQEQWDEFVASNKGRFDLVVFDQRVAHHFAGIENFGETLEGKISNAPKSIHRNFHELLASGADVYIPICEYPYPADQVIDHEQFTDYSERVERHFADCGLRLQRTYDKTVFDMNAEHLEVEPRLSIARQFLGYHPLIKIQLQRPGVVIFFVALQSSVRGFYD